MPLLQQLTRDLCDPNCTISASSERELRLLQALLKAGDSKSSMLIWNKLIQLEPSPQHLLALSLALGRLLAREKDLPRLGVVAHWVGNPYPESEQSKTLELLRTQLAV